MATRLQLLGTVRVRHDAADFQPPPDKRLGLLAHLACTDGWVDRDRLAYLFWPDVPQARARTNLRGLLARTRRLPYAAALVAEPGRIRWPVECDAREFREAVERREWTRAIDAYGGQFLDGVALDGVGELARWLEEERARLRSEHRHAVLAHCRSDGAAPGHVVELLDGLLAHDPLDEEVVQHAIAARALAGRREHALRLGHEFRQRLQEELGLPPTDETERQLAELASGGVVRERADAAPRKPPPAAITLTSGANRPPAALTPFVGREAERRDLAERLARSECRLLTLVGTGGVGKTRLALQVGADLAERYGAGPYVVHLASARSAADVATRVADAFGLRLGRDETAEAAVPRALAGAHALLVLDEAEGALAAAPWLVELITSCPGLDLLVTSRERLGLSEEWVVRLTGLTWPSASATPEDALATDAVRLFRDAAARVEPRFSMDTERLPAVLRICDLVEGLPLGLELAAAWVRALPVADLAQELHDNLELLRRAPRGRDDRHHSVHAALEASWTRLTDEEAEAFASLAVFHGRFQREAAAAIAGVTIPILAALVDKSLLRLSDDGRYDRHPLVTRFARAKLAERPTLAAEVRERHARWFTDRIVEAADRFERSANRTLVERTAEAYGDLLAVLHDAVEAGNADRALTIATSLRWFWSWRGRGREGREQFERVQRMGLPARSSARARLLVIRAEGMGGGPERRNLTEEALAIARSNGDVPLEIECLNNLGFFALADGQPTESGRRFDEALAMAADDAYAGLRLTLLANRAAWELRCGEERGAREALDEAAAAAVHLGNDKVHGLVRLQRARLERRLGNARAARAQFDAASLALRGSGHAELTARAPFHLALTALAEGDPEGARPLLAECLALWWESGSLNQLPDVLRAVAAVCAHAGQTAWAARLWGAADAVGGPEASMLLPSEYAPLLHALDGVRAREPERFEKAETEGRGTSLALAVESAQSVLVEPGPDGPFATPAKD